MEKSKRMKCMHLRTEYVETVTSCLSEAQKFIADVCKGVLLEENRCFCILVDKYCSFVNHIHYYHM